LSRLYYVTKAAENNDTFGLDYWWWRSIPCGQNLVFKSI